MLNWFLNAFDILNLDGTPVVTTRGMKEAEMEILADIIYKSLTLEDVSKQTKRVKELVNDFPYNA